MTVLIATDVFGFTPAVSSLVRSLACECLVLSPYEDTPAAGAENTTAGAASLFSSEQKAYHAFLAGGGVARYADKLARTLRQRHADITMAIGFSAGASALWIVSALPEAVQLQSATLFYGSRIRDHQQLQPVCPVRLIFAEKEAAFDAAQLVAALRQRGHQAELARHTSHGFMNPYARGFCVKTQASYVQQLSVLAQSMVINNQLEPVSG